MWEIWIVRAGTKEVEEQHDVKGIYRWRQVPMGQQRGQTTLEEDTEERKHDLNKKKKTGGPIV